MNPEFRIVENPDPGAWDDFVCAHGGHLLQSAGWGELKARFGWSALRLALDRDGELVAGALVLFRNLPLGLRLAYLPRGPVCDPTDHATFAALSETLSATARARGAFALTIEPDSPSPSPPLFADELRRTGEGRVGVGFQPHTTIHLDLTRDLDTILAQMKPKWRYNIRLAERKGVTVREGQLEDVPTFYRLLQITGARDHFAIHSLAYYRAAFDLLQHHARLFIAEYEREPLAAIFVTAFGAEAIYLYGASSNAHRERMPNHALHWAAMQWAKARGCARYDLWGIGDDRPVRSQRPHRSILPDGLRQFKQGFGGQVVEYVGAYDVVFSRWRYELYRRMLAWRRMSTRP
ncbi:MAG: peptidoglycan bridge formation glycyltransferase FemA/FemB family protein [Chloroflexi bacterium]|nr:peptidoglycan bridge formation glycyltransferase FemA/FemB family protein [Chloroflexota bacterium]